MAPQRSERASKTVSDIAQAQAVSTVRTVTESTLDLLNPLSYRKSPQHSPLLLNKFFGTVAAGQILLVVQKLGSDHAIFLQTVSNLRGGYEGTSGKIQLWWPVCEVLGRGRTGGYHIVWYVSTQGIVLSQHLASYNGLG